ncbi:MAG: histone deacetylase [Bacteroidetes bacterium]|nr:histone deacetylase [Bacteroidota bacterium]MBT6685534.1 histone deacetylase [Bacteroidota bacterium]MBT7144965.1 histone deacetylase [Bacteroidota bacterium]MBT7492485.1 histone deacetylase [Bacteroidota bacterium]
MNKKNSRRNFVKISAFFASLLIFGKLAWHFFYNKKKMNSNNNIDRNKIMDTINKPLIMNRTAYVYDPYFLKHTQEGHPEFSGRLVAIMEKLEDSGILKTLIKIPAKKCTIDQLLLVHPQSHIDNVKYVSESKIPYLDTDTYTNEFSYNAALLAAGSLIELTNAVVQQKVKNGFAIIRPPGHHAVKKQSMGFCIFSNVAIAAKVAQNQFNIKKIAIIDFDVHHGNGTQDIVNEDPDILFISTHQYPLYPGTGRIEETGKGEGKGSTMNIAVPAGTGDEGFGKIYDQIIIPSLHKFQPELILVSAGYDAHWSDPLAGLTLSLEGFAEISKKLINVAEELCKGKIVFSLEGGYNLDALSNGVMNSIKLLSRRDDIYDPIGKSNNVEPDITELIKEIIKIHG